MSKSSTSEEELANSIRSQWKTLKASDKNDLTNADIEKFIEIVFKNSLKSDTLDLKSDLERLLGVE
jgi:hypothetical protein